MGSARGCHSERKTGFKELRDSLSDTAQLPLQCLQCCQPWGVQCGQDAGLPPVPPQRKRLQQGLSQAGPCFCLGITAGTETGSEEPGRGGEDY